MKRGNEDKSQGDGNSLDENGQNWNDQNLEKKNEEKEGCSDDAGPSETKKSRHNDTGGEFKVPEVPVSGSGLEKQTQNQDESSDDDDDDVVGPLPPPEPTAEEVARKKKILEFEAAYLRNIPKGKCYEKSFMHRDVVTHVVATKTDFIITASCDGHVKFWKKLHGEGIEFVKHFRTHLGAIRDLNVNASGTLMCTIGATDRSVKVFDVSNFDMINMIRLPFDPKTAAWVHRPSDPISALAVSDSKSSKIHIYDGKGLAESIHVFDRLHTKPVTIIKFNDAYDCAISVDEMGMIEYWTGPKHEYKFPDTVDWQYKTDTDLYEFAKLKLTPVQLAVSPNGRTFVTLALDRRIRLFRFATGKLIKVLNETLSDYVAQKQQLALATTEFNRRLAVEKELDRSAESFGLQTLQYDESSNFLLYATLVGVKVLNLKTNQCVRVIGKPETMRFLAVSLCRALPSVGEKLQGAATTAEAEASDNPGLKQPDPDPMIVCSAHKRNRFYLFTNAEPFEAGDGDEENANERDVFNEKPLKEDIITAIDEETPERRVTDSCVIHTTMGDIHCKLFPRETPKTVENFCTHARRGYYNGHIFHRVIKSFMIQTGDPTGTGMGGESIWGGEFEDEIVAELKHDKPYTLSMANAGPNTNGSQFFITVVPTPWLDGKHTIFGRVHKGMDVVQSISKVRTFIKTGRPHDEIAIISVTLK